MKSKLLRAWYVFPCLPLRSLYSLIYDRPFRSVHREVFVVGIPYYTTFSPQVNTSLFDNRTVHVLDGTARILFPDSPSHPKYYPFICQPVHSGGTKLKPVRLYSSPSTILSPLNPLAQLPIMSSTSKSPTPSPKSSPRTKSSPLPPLPHSSSSESSATVKIPSPLNQSVTSKRTTPLSSSPDNRDIANRLRVDSSGSTTRSPSPSRIDALSRIVTTNSLQPGRSRSPHHGHATSPSRRYHSHSPDPSESWWGSREVLARPWHEPPKRKKTIPPEHSERWEVTRKVWGLRLWQYLPADFPS